LTVDGLVTVGGAGTNLLINGAAGSIDADDVVINSGGVLELRGGTLTMDEEVGTALIDVNAGGVLQGNGTITFADAPGVATTVLVNDGTLTAMSRGPNIFSVPPVGTLSIPSAGLCRVDLDGSGEAGVVNVNRNQTLDLNPGLADAFNGTMNLFHNSTFDSLSGWILGTGGSLVVDNGFVAGGLGFSDIPADTSFIASGPLTQTGGTINVVDTDGTLQLDAEFIMIGGTFANSGTVIFNGTTNITAASGYAPSSLNAQTIVNADVTINHAAANFNWDGSGAADTTVNGTGSLAITADQIDTGDDIFGGTLNLDGGGDVSVNNTANVWTLGGTLNKTGASVSTISGDAINVTGAINAGGTGTLDLPTTTLSSTANVNVTSRLTLGGASNLAGATISGTGELEMEGTSTVSANTTIGVATFDWDGLGTGTTHTINSGIAFTINSATFDADGDMDDPINLAGNGAQLAVNVVPQWTMNGVFTANSSAAGAATIGGSARMILTNTMNVDGDTAVLAPMTFATGSSASIDAGMTLDLGSSATYQAGTISGAGTFVPAAANLVTGVMTINAVNFDFDAGDWTIQDDGELFIDVGDYDPAVAPNAFDGVVNLDNGAINVSTSDAEFVMDGVINAYADDVSQSLWTGEPIDIGNDLSALDADVNVTGTQPTQFGAQVDFNSDADVNVADGAALHFLAAVNFNSVNGGNNAEFTGSGEMIFSAGVNFSETTTLNMAGGIVDLDGADSIGDTVNVDAPLTINAELLRSFGKNNGGGGTNILDVNNNINTGVLTVNLDNPADEWTLNAPGVMNLVNDNTEATLLAGSDVNVDGTVNVTGDVRTTARLDIAGVVNVNTADQPLRLAGGNAGPDANTISGGTVNGVGQLGADTGKALEGFGTINADIAFVGTASLRAAGGTLTLGGDIVDVNILGTADDAGVLNVTNPWETDGGAGGSIGAVVLTGGMLQGGTITNDNANGIQGHGTIASRVINTSKIVATNGGTLIVQTPGNNNDWDGAGNVGELEALSADLEMVDTTGPVPPVRSFGGSVRAINDNRVFANGFALDFLPGSSLELEDEAIYRASSSTDIGGTVTIGAGADATIQVANNFFLTFETGSTTTLNGDVTLINNNINIEQGAVFNNGGGALIIPDGSHMVADNLADIDVLLDMQGAFRPGNFNGIGRVDLFDYQQGNTGELYVELIGTSLNAFDRLVASGDVLLDGYLNIDIDEISPGVPFVPSLGQTFNIITGNSVVGEFDYADVSGMPDGLAFHINYLANAVQLQVVNEPLFSADFDEDGDVDPTDLAIWKGAFNLNQLGDADGDNDSDGADFLLWQQQFGSAPAVVVVQPAAAAVPEPSAAALLLVAMAGAGWRRLRGRSRR
jgi:fibronectin-binding autotransporter adhesin